MTAWTFSAWNPFVTAQHIHLGGSVRVRESAPVHDIVGHKKRLHDPVMVLRACVCAHAPNAIANARPHETCTVTSVTKVSLYARLHETCTVTSVTEVSLYARPHEPNAITNASWCHRLGLHAASKKLGLHTCPRTRTRLPAPPHSPVARNGWVRVGVPRGRRSVGARGLDPL